MSDIHISEDLLCAHVRDVLPDRQLLDILLNHVAAICPHCRTEVKRFEQGRKGERGSLHTFLNFALQTVEQQMEAISEDETRARQDLRVLLKLSADEQVRRVRRARTRFRSLRLVELLIEESQASIFEDPLRAGELAMLATEVIWYDTGAVRRANELLALAFAYTANAARVRGDFAAAEEYIMAVRSTVRKAGITDSHTLAEIDHREAALRHMLRALPTAERLLKRAVLLFTLAGETGGAAQALIALGYLHSDAGREDQAISITKIALTLLDECDTRSILCARHNLTWSLCNLERYEEAETLFQGSQDLYEQFLDPWTQCRRAWINARIDAGSHREAPAEERFLKTYEDLCRNGYPYDAVLLALDLVDLYLRQGRMHAVAEVAEALSVVFAAKGIHREVVSALRLFQEKARQEEVTQRLRIQLGRYLVEARHQPGLRFRSES